MELIFKGIIMVGEVLFVTFAMFIIAAVAFLPLGFFIVIFTKNAKQPFGKGHTASHGLSPFMEKADPYFTKTVG